MDKPMTSSDGGKIRELREGAGMTQEKLAIMSRVDRRTVQRAEQGTRLQMETLSSLAAALNVPVSQIISTELKVDEIDELTAKSLVVLNRIQSGIALLNIVRDNYDGRIACEAEPTPDNVDALTSIIGKLEEIMPDPWRRAQDDVTLTLSDRLRAAVAIGEQIKVLEGKGVAFYAGTYTARTQIPWQDYDTGEMQTSSRTPYQLVTNFVVIVAPLSNGERITVKEKNVYAPPKAPAFESGFEGPPAKSPAGPPPSAMEDDIPF
jgi:transcriptional regulator with XRE-family HTH domain